MKRVIGLLLSAVLAFSCVACSPGTSTTGAAASTGAVSAVAAATTSSGTAADASAPAASTGGKIKIGMTFSDLSNPVWAELVKEAQSYGSDKNVEVTYVDAKNDAAKQITQIEDFVQNGMNAIIVCAVDASTLKDATQKAMDAGVKIVAYTQHLDNYDSEYVLNAYQVGQMCGKAAAKWINKNFKPTETVEWGLMDLPRFPEIITRANGIKDAVAKNAPNAKLVATNFADTAADGIKNAENFLQAHPNMKMIACIGGGGSVGGNEGVKQFGKTGKDFGLFGIDATEQEIKNIMAGDPQQSSVSLGGGKAHGRTLIDISLKFVNKEKVDKTNYMTQTLIDASNAKEYYAENYAK